MKIEDLKPLLDADSPDYVRLISIFESSCVIGQLKDSFNRVIDSKKEYDPCLHKVNDRAERKDKMIDNEGNKSTIPVARLALPIQKNIVLIAAAFLGCPEATATASTSVEQNLVNIINKISEDNKLDYKFNDLVKRTMSERHSAELWYTEDAESDYYAGYEFDSKFKLRVRLLAESLGDCMYPVFDDYGDMIAFGRGYFTMDIGESGLIKTEHLDVYTADNFYYATKSSAGWSKKQIIPNAYGKIPVIYYCKPLTEWHDVQPLIERLEKIISNHADTNDYFSSPIVFADGDVTGFSNKGEQGKVLEGKNGAKVSYLTWDNAPESLKMEISNLLSFIDRYTHTPNISFENMKGLGVFSGIALKMLFLDAHMKATDNEKIFGEPAKRRYNYLKAIVAKLDPKLKAAITLSITPKFTYLLPENLPETIDMLVAATAGKLLSYESAVEQNPLVSDATSEKDRLETEATASPALPISDPSNPIDPNK